MRVSFNATCLTVLVNSTADILIALEKPEDLSVAVFLIPARSLAEILIIDTRVSLGVESDFLAYPAGFSSNKNYSICGPGTV